MTIFYFEKSEIDLFTAYQKKLQFILKNA